MSHQRHSNLYVKNIPDDIDEEGLRRLFSKFGPIEGVRVMADHANRSRSFGFVNFLEVGSAEAAIAELNGAEVVGRKLLVKFADTDGKSPNNKGSAPSDNVYVKGLPESSTEDAIASLFSPYGTVSQVRIVTRSGHAFTGEALVRMATADQAAYAIEELNSSELHGCPLLVRYADSPADRQKKKQQLAPRGQQAHQNTFAAGDGYSSSQSWTPPHAQYGAPPSTLYVNELPSDADDLLLYRTFAPYGAIVSVRSMSDESGQCRGFGFVNFVHYGDAELAIRAVNGRLLHGRLVHVSHKKPSTRDRAQAPHDAGAGAGHAGAVPASNGRQPQEACRGAAGGNRRGLNEP